MAIKPNPSPAGRFQPLPPRPSPEGNATGASRHLLRLRKYRRCRGEPDIGEDLSARGPEHSPKSVKRCSKKIMLKQQLERDDVSKKGHLALVPRGQDCLEDVPGSAPQHAGPVRIALCESHHEVSRLLKSDVWRQWHHLRIGLDFEHHR